MKRHFSPRGACRKPADRIPDSVHPFPRVSRMNEMTQRRSGPYFVTSRREISHPRKSSVKSSNFWPSPRYQPPAERPVDAPPVVEANDGTSHSANRQPRYIVPTLVPRAPIGRPSCRAAIAPRRAAPTAIINANAGANGAPVGLNVRGCECDNVDFVGDPSIFLS